MKARVITFAVLLTAALVGHVVGLRLSPEYRARVHEYEQGFLDFLVANSQDSFAKAVPETSSEVVFIDFREEDKAEFEAWPPAPLDYIMLLKKLSPAEPSVLAFTEPLRWEGANAEFIQQLRVALLPVPSLILGFDVSTEAIEMSPEQKEFLERGMPSFNEEGAGNPAAATASFKSITRLPDKVLRIGTEEMGIARVSSAAPAPATEGDKDKDRDKKQSAGSASFPFVANDGTHLVPSLAAQAVSRFRRMASSELSLRFGQGARLSLSDAHIVPLEEGGTMKLLKKPSVPTLDALGLFDPLADEPTLAATAQTLGKGKVLVIGTGAVAASQAQAIAQALAVPQLHRAPVWGDWAFAGAVALFSLWQFHRGRIKALLAGVLLAALAAIVCMLTFQSSLWWWSPASATVVLATTTLFCFLWPYRKVIPVDEVGKDAPAVAEGSAAV
ncbi:CHASE2 domain-containing protein [Roseimicrobium sp. ORNL1]|uniref:CHASE2 domain-containing protein n=1 Tax=Roseimicrobium sp. ORNL1 TaxID=2711231 RepID=UPI0013E17B33|nr:CHASE2 domain-containing protein [Roseimicrobium sp. ORNL1]QIF04944.1 CHASE2 domain-containing protein [Roseimicrobium sp. ORNL1]